jgi:two-component system phosphate regulon sensor histidine kinase PhoR
MQSDRTFLRQTLTTAAILSLPTAAILAGLAAMGRLGLWSALALWIIGAGGTALLLRKRMALLLGIKHILDDLGRSADGKVTSITLPDDFLGLGTSIRRLLRVWHDRTAQFDKINREAGSIVDNLPDAIIVVDRAMVARRVNKAASRLLGAELIGRDFATIVRDPGLLEAVGSVLGDGRSRDVELRLPGRVVVDLRAHIEPLPSLPGAESWLLLAFHDQTDVKRTAQMRADFVANASHELRTPLSALIGFIETLRSGADENQDTRRRFLNIMGEQAIRMARLVGDLLSLSRIEMHEHSQPTDAVDLPRIIRSVIDVLQLRARDREITLTIDLPPDLPSIAGDADELTQLVQNLVDNAIKYARPGSAIEIAARRETLPPATARYAENLETVAVSVRDHGEGIPREHLARLTERFYRVDAARSRELGGTGLGLAIVKHIVNRHRGTLSIESTPGQGSTFTVHLPVPDSPTT